MIQASTIAALAKVSIASNPKFKGVTPELDAVISAIADGVATAVNAELATMKLLYNLHTHVSPVGPTLPPVPSMT
jgi:hypothetical protein